MYEIGVILIIISPFMLGLAIIGAIVELIDSIKKKRSKRKVRWYRGSNKSIPYRDAV